MVILLSWLGAYLLAAVMRNLITMSLATMSNLAQAPSPIEKSPRRIVKAPSKTPVAPCAVKVAGTTMSCVLP
jgi:hypothetical protein